MMNQEPMLNVKWPTKIKKLKGDVCVKSPGENCFSALIGNEEDDKEEIFKAVKAGAVPRKDVFWVETSLEAVEEIPEVANPFWWFWIPMFKEMITQVPFAALEQLAEGGEKEVMDSVKKIQDIYAFYAHEENWKLLNTQNGREEDIKKLFECYTKLKVQIIWVLRAFERMELLFPKDGEEGRRKAGGNIYNKLFVLSPKSIEEYYLNLLVISKKEVIELEHSMAGGSSLAAAFESTRL